MITKEDLLKHLQELREESDIELGHAEADALLLEFIDDHDISLAFRAIKKWYA